MLPVEVHPQAGLGLFPGQPGESLGTPGLSLEFPSCPLCFPELLERQGRLNENVVFKEPCRPFFCLWFAEHGILPVSGECQHLFPAKIVSRLMKWTVLPYEDYLVGAIPWKGTGLSSPQLETPHPMCGSIHASSDFPAPQLSEGRRWLHPWPRSPACQLPGTCSCRNWEQGVLGHANLVLLVSCTYLSGNFLGLAWGACTTMLRPCHSITSAMHHLAHVRQLPGSVGERVAASLPLHAFPASCAGLAEWDIRPNHRPHVSECAHRHRLQELYTQFIPSLWFALQELPYTKDVVDAGLAEDTHLYYMALVERGTGMLLSFSFDAFININHSIGLCMCTPPYTWGWGLFLEAKVADLRKQ